MSRKAFFIGGTVLGAASVFYVMSPFKTTTVVEKQVPVQEEPKKVERAETIVKKDDREKNDDREKSEKKEK
jgi:hypothetical protein